MIRGVIFDWAGTTVDDGCLAPVAAFDTAFAKAGIHLTEREIREPMGLLKIDHIKTLLALPHVKVKWQELYERKVNQADVKKLYADFEKVLFSSLAQYTTPKEGLLKTVHWLRKNNIKIGSTTGYTKDMMRIVAKGAKQNGYEPDFLVTPDDVNGVGRPAPDMIFRNVKLMGINDLKRVIKVGDTTSDIKEGKNAGVISVGVIEGSSASQLTAAAFSKLSFEEKESLREAVTQKYYEDGADYVIDRLSDLPFLVKALNEELEFAAL